MRHAIIAAGWAANRVEKPKPPRAGQSRSSSGNPADAHAQQSSNCFSELLESERKLLTSTALTGLLRLQEGENGFPRLARLLEPEAMSSRLEKHQPGFRYTLRENT